MTPVRSSADDGCQAGTVGRVNAMMGLDARLKQARIGVVIGVDSPERIAEVGSALARSRVDLVVLDATGADREDFLRGFAGLRRAVGTHTIAGVLAPADLASVARADLVVDLRVRPHAHCLKLGRVTTIAEFDACDADAIVIPEGLIPHAIRTAPATQLAAKPWFVHLTDPTLASRTILAGARRLWLHGLTGQQIPVLREELSSAWKTDMGPVTLGGWNWRRG